MEFTITRDTRNELLTRREVEFALRFEGATPARQMILGKLGATLNVNEKQMILDSLKTKFGTQTLIGKARIYDTEDAKLRTERDFLMKRGVPKPKEEEAA